MNQHILSHLEYKVCDRVSPAKCKVHISMAVLAKQLFFSHVFYFLRFQINSKVILFGIKGILACATDLSTSLSMFPYAQDAQIQDLCFLSHKT